MIMNRLRQLREERHMNQQRLSVELNVSQAMISKYERGESEPDVYMIKTIADYFGVSADYLLEISDDKNISPPGLSSEEKEILFGYKRLDKIKKAKLQAYLQGLLQE